jgi:hypothetical protein
MMMTDDCTAKRHAERGCNQLWSVVLSHAFLLLKIMSVPASEGTQALPPPFKDVPATRLAVQVSRLAVESLLWLAWIASLSRWSLVRRV